MGSTAAVVLAGGRGTRVGAGVNKVLIDVAGRAVIDWSVRAFAGHPAIGRTVLVGHPDDLAELARRIADLPAVELIAGGKERADSERAALDLLRADIRTGSIGSVLLHDGARPCVSAALISAAAELAAVCGALPALEAPLLARSVDGALREVPGPLVRAQTPQGGPAGWLLAAYDAALAQGFVGTDTASYLEHAGYRVQTFAGDPENLKVTYPEDVARAAAVLTARRRG